MTHFAQNHRSRWKTITRLVVIFCLPVLSALPVIAQTGRLKALIQVKDTLVARYNRGDFDAFYELADTSFSHYISRPQLTEFLRSQKNNGKIVATTLLADSSNGRTYFRVSFDLRDMTMVLRTTSDGKFTTFGLSNLPAPRLPYLPVIPCNNPLKTPLDRIVDSVAREYFRNPNHTALSIGFRIGGKSYRYHYGELKKGSGKLPDDATGYEIGSITKTITATLLARAVLEKRLALNDDIRKYLPGDYPDLAWHGSAIKIQDLANHTSGLPTLPGNFERQSPFIHMQSYAHYTETLFWQALKQFRPDTLPGTRFSYSNMGFAVLGSILERIYGKPYRSILKTALNLPMPHTLNGFSSGRRASGYSENGREVPASALGLFDAAGGICSSLQEMLHYVDAQLTETDPAIRLTHVPTTNTVRLSWGVLTLPSGGRMIQHSGSTGGFTSNVTLYPEKQKGMVILTNTKSNVGPVVIALSKWLSDESSTGK
ncbi:serine hydrolase domain-containing protein [Siphonobacter aquaeclarae]|uniref:CubicO group peptidase, beta-lactamase class C family n=1 Tax=Siphonobacter aquaeclarae TaxID=563176 RepID=A0A1G9JTP2_9BACT|nr:serine hydrolase domain-containing protein [Siphonobacter aquaeclarae]SDL40897.1 CubicO group peptidase, beta-lactamase class C family [Siphonobacter aquaeclarae]